MIVTEDGIYRVTGSELVAAGIDTSMIDPETLAVRYLVQNAAIVLADGGDGSLDESDYLLFWAEAPDSLFTKTNVYWLIPDVASAPRMQVLAARPGDAPFADSFVCTRRLEEDNLYWQSVPDGAFEDHWFWIMMEASVPTVVTFDIHNLSERQFDASIEVELRGGTDTFQDPDHHTRLLLNGVLIDDQFWDGQLKFSHTVSVDQSLLRNGQNELMIEYPGDTEALIDRVYLNYIGTILYYPRFGVGPAPLLYAALTGPGDMSLFNGEISAATFEVR